MASSGSTIQLVPWPANREVRLLTPLLIAAPAGSHAAWMTLTRRAQVLRGHDRSGRIVWESPIPWEAWQLVGIGSSAVVVAPDGRTIAFDSSGHALTQGRADGVPEAFCQGSRGETLRIVRQGVHLLCTDLSGRVVWRAIAEATLGPVAAGRQGTAVMIGKSLAWFSTIERTR